jgi:hypothetical protein
MPLYTVFMETTIVKQATVQHIEAPTLAKAVEIAGERIKRNDVDWGNVEVGQRFVDVVEEGDPSPAVQAALDGLKRPARQRVGQP